MRVAVNVTTDARVELLTLLSRRTPNEGDAVRQAALLVEEMVRQFREHCGPPPTCGARTVPDGTMWWHYADGIWTHFAVETRGSRLLGSVRTVTVFGFEAHPPAPGGPR